MPTEVWGFKAGDRVEVRIYEGSAVRSTVWHLGTILRVTPQRTLMVIVDGRGTHEVTRPDRVRMWKAPRTSDDIEAFLNGG